MAEHKRRARWRLLGALIIVAAVGAIAPVFLEDQARPLSQDLLIEIPSRNSLFTKIDQLKPTDSAAESSQPSEAKSEESAQKTVTESSPAATSTPTPVAASPAPAATPKIDVKPEAKSESKSEPKAAPKSDAAKATGSATGSVATPKASTAPSPITDSGADAAQKPGKGFLVQVGVYSKIETAKSVQAKLTLGGHKVWLEPVVRDDGIERYRVRIGPFETREQALEVRDRAKSQGYEAIVVGNS